MVKRNGQLGSWEEGYLLLWFLSGHCLCLNQQCKINVSLIHRLSNNNRYNTRFRLFKIQGFFVHNNPEAEAQRSSAQADLNYKTAIESMRCLRGTPLFFCLRIIVNENPINLEKTTSSFQSVLWLSTVVPSQLKGHVVLIKSVNKVTRFKTAHLI